MAHLYISSMSNPRVKAASKLRQGRGRAKQGRIIIDGRREVERAMRSGVAMAELFVSEQVESPETNEIVQLAERGGAEILVVTKSIFEKLAYGDRSEGFVGVAPTPEPTLDRLAFRMGENPVLAVIEQVEKPGNIGAALRSADGAGISGLIAADARTDLYNPNAIRASLGAIFSTPVAAATSEETVNWLRERDIRIYAAWVDETAIPYTQADFTVPSAIVLGNEAEGLSDAWRSEHVTPIYIPMHGIADSLNVSAAATVLFYEAWRQRNAS